MQAIDTSLVAIPQPIATSSVTMQLSNDTNFLKFLSEHGRGVLLLFFSLAAIILLIQWLAWIFSIGRFRPDKASTKVGMSSLRFVFADLIVKIIDDFRHFLALIVVMIFALALAYTLFCTEGKMAEVKDALQVVMATLGGLVGSILGYYFGESAARKSLTEDGEHKHKPDEMKQESEKPPRPAPPPPQTIAEPSFNPEN